MDYRTPEFWEKLKSYVNGLERDARTADSLAMLYDEAKRQRDEAQEAAHNYWEAWQDATVYWKERVTRLEAEYEELRARMRSGWRLVEREGIDPRLPPRLKMMPDSPFFLRLKRFRLWICRTFGHCYEITGEEWQILRCRRCGERWEAGPFSCWSRG